MENIVIKVIDLAGGIGNLAKLHNVSFQAVYLWKVNGYFPPKQIQKVNANFPEVAVSDLWNAYHQRQPNP